MVKTNGTEYTHWQQKNKNINFEDKNSNISLSFILSLMFIYFYILWFEYKIICLLPFLLPFHLL